MMSIEFKRQARNEYIAAGQWYDRQQMGLGARFLDTVDEFIDCISLDPMRYPIVVKDVRESFVGAFPFYVYYRIQMEGIQIVGVIHSARDTEVLLSRIETD